MVFLLGKTSNSFALITLINHHTMKTAVFKNALPAKQASLRQRLTRCKIFLYLIVIAISLSSCSKDEGGGSGTSDDYYFRASLDGRKVDFHTVNFQGSEDAALSVGLL